MIDLSCLEDVCGDPNVLLKPIEHIVWVVRERVRSVLCGLGKPAQVKKKKKKKKISPRITHEIAKKHKATTNFQCARFAPETGIWAQLGIYQQNSFLMGLQTGEKLGGSSEINAMS